MTKVSIIIPMYNEQRYIARCLDSLKLQSYKDFELILIDDESKDDTVKIAEWYKKDFNLTILQQKNSGPGKARNRWATGAKWNILIFVDADMYFDEWYLQHLIQPILDGNEIGTAHWQELVWNPNNKLAVAWCINRIPHPEKRSGVYRAILKDVFLKSGGFDPSKWYFDDNLNKINNWKWALTVMKAICYHNNPENLQEIYKHSQRVGKSLLQSGEIKTYLKAYKKRIIGLIFIFWIWIIFLDKQIWMIVSIMIGSIIVLMFIKVIQRTIEEKYSSHIIYIPLMMMTRWFGYVVWMIKYLIVKK